MAAATPFPVTGDGVVFAGPCTYRGMRLRDTSGAANTITVYDNASAAAGTVVDVLQLGANAADGTEGDVVCAKGVYVDTTGAVVGSVRIA